MSNDFAMIGHIVFDVGVGVLSIVDWVGGVL
jgi:hypothetical protein